MTLVVNLVYRDIAQSLCRWENGGNTVCRNLPAGLCAFAVCPGGP